MANEAATNAMQAKKSGDLLAALDFHSQAAKIYREIAVAVKDQNGTLVHEYNCALSSLQIVDTSTPFTPPL
jgi:hypothetical protein